MKFLLLLVASWWVCNVVSTIASKTFMLDALSRIVPDEDVLPLAFRDLRWLDLTIVQHLVAALAASVWVVLVQGDRTFPTL